VLFAAGIIPVVFAVKAVVVNEAALTVLAKTVLAFTVVMVADVELTTELTVALPTLIPDVVRFTLAPTLIDVVMLAVAGSLAVSNVPDVILVALDEYTVAFEYADTAVSYALLTLLAVGA
jgi:hypothetical protein